MVTVLCKFFFCKLTWKCFHNPGAPTLLKQVPARVNGDLRNFDIPGYASSSGRHDVGQANVNISQQLESDRRSGVSTNYYYNLFASRCAYDIDKLINIHAMTARNN